MKLHVNQHASYSESSLPLTMSVAKRFRSLVEPRLKLIPSEWSFDDRVLALIAPNLAVDINRFHNSNGPAFSEMFNPDQIRHLDQDFVTVLGNILDVSILENLVTQSQNILPARPKKKRRTKTTNEHWTSIVGKDTWFAMAHWAKKNNKLTPKARNFLYNIGIVAASERSLTQAQDKWARQIFEDLLTMVFKKKNRKINTN